jgi:selenoprotein W-related protein
MWRTASFIRELLPVVAVSLIAQYMVGMMRLRESGGIDQRQSGSVAEVPAKVSPPMSLPMVEIEYCRQCRWQLRAAWMAQEMLTTFEEEIGGVLLKPGTGGVFKISVDGETVWSRKEQGRHAEITELKQLVRDRVAPGRSLGHSDRKRAAGGEATT